VQERFDRLVELVKESALSKNRALIGSVQEVLVEGPSKRDDTLLLARTEGNKVVHAPPPARRTPEELAGTILDVEIDAASTWFLSGRIRG
jgi:tRNA-2-methylthio-N6-dimethylallyladenosine synthase